MAGAVNSFSLIRMASTTHTVNTDQRRIALTPTVSGLKYTIMVPGDAGVALPGYWMLFALDSAGVPSLAKTVLITL
jgi:galactose oxidase